MKHATLSIWGTAATAAVVSIAFATVLHLMGRIPYCECGLHLLTTDAWSNETSQHLFDPYSFSHVLHGILFYAFLWLIARKLPVQHRLLAAMALEITWEILENSPLIINRYRSVTAALDYTGDSILNSLGDLCSAVVGFWIARRLPLWVVVCIAVAMEVATLIAMRDNLTLNIIMLLWPLDAIKAWQLGQ